MATVKYLQKDTKPCPKCGARISKVDGCDQMWCVGCKCTFSWNTGKIQTGGVLHNPEYYRWMREQNIQPPQRTTVDANGLPAAAAPPAAGAPPAATAPPAAAAGAAACEPAAGLVLGDWRHKFRQPADEQRFERMYRALHHLRYVVQGLEQQERTNLDLRVRYLLKEIDRKKMEYLLLKRERMEMKRRYWLQLNQAAVQVLDDYLRKMYDQPACLPESMRELDQFVSWLNTQAHDFEKSHKLTLPRFTSTLGHALRHALTLQPYADDAALTAPGNSEAPAAAAEPLGLIGWDDSDSDG